MKQKVFKSISIILTLLIAFSVCLCAVSNVAAAEAVYYVSATGNDENSGTIESAPLLTVDEAVKKAVEANYKAGDTVTVKVMGTDAVDWVSEGSLMTEHDFKLYITSASTDGGAKVGSGANSVHFGGEVEFGKITVNFGKTYKHICGNGNNITFSEGVIYGGNNQMSYFSIGAWDGNVKSVYNDDITFNCSAKIAKIGLQNNYSSTTLNGKLNVNYNCSTATPIFYISNYDNSIIYNNAVNINLLAAKGAKFAKYSGGKNPVFGENGYFQVINSGTVDISIAETDLSLMPADKVWVLNNKSGNNALISATDTKGKFAVDAEKYQNIKAVSDIDSSVVINEENGFLTLPAGQYTITADKKPLYATYYVSADGSDTNDGKSDASAVTTVQKAVELANADGYVFGDYITVKLLGESVNMGNMPAYEYNLTVEGEAVEDTVTRLVMDSNKTIANSQGKGLTTYKSVDLHIAAQWSRYEATNSNIVFDTGTKLSGSWAQVVFGTNTDGGSSKSIAGQRIVVKTALPDDGISFGNFGWSKRTYTENLDLVLDHLSKHKIRFNTYASGESKGTETYNKNVNIYIEQAKGLEFCYFDKATFNGGLNIFNSSTVLINANVPGYDKLPENTWIFNNKSGMKNAIIATDEAGKFTTELDASVVKIVATDKQGATCEMQNGIISLEAGEYDITVTCIGEHKFGEYIDDNNASCGKNATKTAVCGCCGAKDSREIEGTALTHTYSSKVDKICNYCEGVRSIEGTYAVKDSISGELVLYKNGTISFGSGIAALENEYLYFQNGTPSDVTALVYENDEWYYVEDGKWDDSYCNLFKYQGQYIYVKDGKWDSNFTALVKFNNKWFNIENGIWVKKNGLVKFNGVWFYVNNGKWDTTVTNTLKKYNGVWFWIVKGKWDSKVEDLVKYEGVYFYIKSGKWNSSTQTLFKKSGKWFAVKSGKWYKSKNVVYYSDKWFLVEGGFAQLKFTGKTKINNKTYTFNKGKLTSPKLSKPSTKPLVSTPTTPAPTWTPTVEENTVTETKRIICWGDSITRGMGMSIEKKYPSVLQSLIGDSFEVINGGSSGEQSQTIAARQGAHKVILDKDIVFDSGVATVEIGGEADHSMMLEDGVKLELNSSGEAFTNDIPSNIVYIGGHKFKLSVSNKIFYLIREDSTEELVLEEGSEVVFDSALKQQGSYVEIFYVGANDGLSASEKEIEYLINRYKAMIERHGNDNYIIIIPQWDTGFASAFKQEFGDKAIDIRTEMCSRDLSVVGLTMTDTDRAEAAAGIIPTSLKYENNPNDSLHFNEYGYKLLGTILYEHGVNLGYWK